MSALSVSSILPQWRDDHLANKAPTLYPLGGPEFGHIECGPGVVIILGGKPGAGKSALINQWVINALILTKKLRALICCVEMSPQRILDRQLARLSGISMNEVKHRRLTTPQHMQRFETAYQTLESLQHRLAFVPRPYSIEHIAQCLDETQADLLVIDYIQRIRPLQSSGNKKHDIDGLMDFVRGIAENQVAVILAAAVGRQKSSENGNSTYENLSLASFRESSELEFGADEAFILQPCKTDKSFVLLKHEKSRDGECKDLPLRFNGAVQRFENDPSRSQGKR